MDVSWRFGMTRRRCKTCLAKGNESVKRSKAFLNIDAKLVGAHLEKGNCSISSSERPLVPFIWFLRRLFALFGDSRTRRRRFRLPCTFPPLRFICWSIIGIGAIYVFLYFIGTLRFGSSFLLACTDFFIFFTRTLSFARTNVVTMFRNKPGKGDSFLIFPFRWHSFSRNLSVVVFVDKTNSNIALRVFRHFVRCQFVKDAWLERGSSTWNTFSLCDWLLSNAPWDLWS